MKKLLIAIDGHSASGKGSLAKKVASHFNLSYLNTGALYRFVAFIAVKNNISDIENHLDFLIESLKNSDLENEELFSEKIGQQASIIAQNKNLRNKLFVFQRNFIENVSKRYNGCVLDGRDIASKIMPEADFKFFITADVEIRAKRRFEQFKKSKITFEEILDKLKQRDFNDESRENSPLLVDKNAIIIDTSFLTIDEGFEKILNAVISANQYF